AAQQRRRLDALHRFADDPEFEFGVVSPRRQQQMQVHSEMAKPVLASYRRPGGAHGFVEIDPVKKDRKRGAADIALEQTRFEIRRAGKNRFGGPARNRLFFFKTAVEVALDTF